MTNQRRLRLMRAGGGLLAASTLGLLAPAARAADCSTLPHLVVVAGSTASKKFVGAIAVALSKEATPINVVYQGGGSCAVGVASQGPTPQTISGTAVTFTGSEEAPTDGLGCDLDAAGSLVDIGVSDVYYNTCGSTFALGTGVKEHPGGPIQSMNFVVLKDSAQQAISYDAAFLALGFAGTANGGAGAGVPWNDPSVIEMRGPGSGTQQMISAAIALDATKWKGNVQGSGGDVRTRLAAHTAEIDTAIGILSSSDADPFRATYRILSYQHKDQTCGFTPDSDSTTAFDKANVRDGHYAIWGPMHFYAKDTSPDVKKVLDILTGKVIPDFDLIKLEQQASIVPDCAMRVSRTEEIGPMTSYMPTHSCECKYVFEATRASPAGCAVCDDNNPCTNPKAPSCNFGYCEAQ